LTTLAPYHSRSTIAKAIGFGVDWALENGAVDCCVSVELPEWQVKNYEDDTDNIHLYEDDIYLSQTSYKVYGQTDSDSVCRIQ
jgi:hypothetical protein